MAVKQVSGLHNAAREMTRQPGTHARLFDMRHGQGFKLADVRVCADEFDLNLRRIQA